MNTSNATRKTTTKAGAPHYANLYKIECEKTVATQSKLDECRKSFGASLVERDKLSRKIAHRKQENTSLLNEIARIKKENVTLNGLYLEESSLNDQLVIEARKSYKNHKEAKYYKWSARCWCAASVAILAGIVALAVSL